MTIVPASVWTVAVFAAFVLFFATPANADPVAEVKNGSVRIVLHNDSCGSDVPSNLPYKATYEDGGKVAVGCWGINELKIVAFWFPSDRTVFGLPLQLFQKVVAI